MKNVILSGTTAADGSLTVTSSDGGATGFIEKIVYDYQDADTGADLTITGVEAGVSIPLLTVTNAGTADVTWFPRTLANKVADASAFTDVAEKIFVAEAEFKVVVAQGGNAKDIKLVVYLSDE